MAKFFGKTPAKGGKPGASAGAPSHRPASLSKPVITSDEDKALLFQQTPKEIPEKNYPREGEKGSVFSSEIMQEQQGNPNERFHKMASWAAQEPTVPLKPDHGSQQRGQEPSVNWKAGNDAYPLNSTFSSREKPIQKDSLNNADFFDDNGKNFLGNSNVYLERINFLTEKLNRCQRLQRLLLAAVIFATAANVLQLVL